MVPRTGHAGGPRLQETIRVRSRSTNQTIHTDFSAVHENMGRGSVEGIHAIMEIKTRQKHQEFLDKRDWRNHVQLGSRKDKR